MKRGVGLMALLAAALASSTTFAARPGVVIGTPQIVQQLVEQQDNIANPTACLWDTDDSFVQTAFGRWAAGQTVSLETCVIADHIAHRVSWVSDFGAGCYLTPEYDANDVETLPPVGDGHGVLTPLIVAVTNDGRHPAKAGLRFEVGPRWMECL